MFLQKINGSMMFRVLSVLIPVLSIGIFVFVGFMIFSPKARAKMMRRQVESVQMMFDQTKDVFKDLSASTIEMQKDILSQNREDLKDIETMNMDIKEDTIRRTAQAIKEGLSDSSVRCRYCGQLIDGDSKFCKNCGREQ